MKTYFVEAKLRGILTQPKREMRHKFTEARKHWKLLRHSWHHCLTSSFERGESIYIDCYCLTNYCLTGFFWRTSLPLACTGWVWSTIKLVFCTVRSLSNAELSISLVAPSRMETSRPRIKPWPPWCEAWTLPMCYSPPHLLSNFLVHLH